MEMQVMELLPNLSRGGRFFNRLCMQSALKKEHYGSLFESALERSIDVPCGSFSLPLTCCVGNLNFIKPAVSA